MKIRLFSALKFSAKHRKHLPRLAFVNRLDDGRYIITDYPPSVRGHRYDTDLSPYKILFGGHTLIGSNQNIKPVFLDRAQELSIVHLVPPEITRKFRIECLQGFDYSRGNVVI